MSRAYNTGIAASSGEVLAFTDDDCVVPPDWITTIVSAFAAEPDGDLLYGQVIPLAGLDDDRGWSPKLEIHEPRRLSRGDGWHIFGMGANFAARRRLFVEVGPFDVVPRRRRPAALLTGLRPGLPDVPCRAGDALAPGGHAGA